MSIANQTWPGSLCVGRECRGRVPFNPALRDYYLAIAYPKCECKNSSCSSCFGMVAAGHLDRCPGGAGHAGCMPLTRVRCCRASCRDHLQQCPMVGGPRGHPQADCRDQAI